MIVAEQVSFYAAKYGYKIFVDVGKLVILFIYKHVFVDFSVFAAGFLYEPVAGKSFFRYGRSPHKGIRVFCQKFELACKVLDLDPADFNDDSKMTLAMQSYVSSEMQSYVREQQKLRNNGEAYDADAFDAKGNALAFYGE